MSKALFLIGTLILVSTLSGCARATLDLGG